MQNVILSPIGILVLIIYNVAICLPHVRMNVKLTCYI